MRDDQISHRDPARRMGGLFIRRERWGLSWRGWLVLGAAAFLVFLTAVFRVYPFLAVTDRSDGGLLVVEGWVHEYAIRSAAEEFKSGGYQRVFTTGGPVGGMGGYTNDYNTSASVAAGLLKKVGLPADSVQMVPSHVIDRDRTYNSAVALRDWLREHGMAVERLNVVTENVHARRSRLLFQKAFGDKVTVGVIAVPNPDYDGKHWWRYSEGVKDVISEGAAYVYARLFFWN